MKSPRFRWFGGALLLLVMGSLLASVGAGAGTSGGTKLRWDIISVDFASGTLSAGGEASALAHDGSKITLTGSGTFRLGRYKEVTGGGTWTGRDPAGNVTKTGTYKVTRYAGFVLAPGTPPLPNDKIGVLANNRAGLLALKIEYSDGSRGILVVSCHLVGTPDSVFEGITASHGFVDYSNPEAPPAPPGNANRTTFHVIQ